MIAVTMLLERLTLPSPSLQSAYIVAHEYGSSETEAKVKRGRSEDNPFFGTLFAMSNLQNSFGVVYLNPAKSSKYTLFHNKQIYYYAVLLFRLYHWLFGNIQLHSRFVLYYRTSCR